MDKKLKIGLHIHSWLSGDTSWTREQFIDLYQQAGFDALVVCDHDEITAAQELEKMNLFRIVIGEEICTKEGEIIGLFLKFKIPDGLSMSETILKIRAQKGLVCLPHPFDRLRHNVINLETLEKNLNQIDLIEIFNARSIFKKDDQKAQELATKHQIAQIVGSDAHTKSEISCVYMEIDDFKSPDQFLQSIKKGRIIAKKSPIWVHLLTKIKKINNGRG